MRKRHSAVLWLATAATAVQVCAVSQVAAGSAPPPVVSLLGVEGANVIDDTGAEMWQVTVGISNAVPTFMAGPHFEPVYIKDGDVPVEARVGGRWTKIEAVIGTCALRPYGSDTHRILLVVPAKADSVRIHFKYTSASVFSGRLSYLSEDLPVQIRTNMPATFWRSVGFVHYGPSSDWQEQKVELPLHLPAELHNQHLQETPR